MDRKHALTAIVAAGLVLGSAPVRQSSPGQTRDRPGSVWNGDIYVVNADGTGKTRLTRDPAEEFGPAWSPDGTKIAFSRFTGRRYQLFVMNADGTNAVQLTDGDGAASDAAWSPDGSRIAYTLCRGSCDIYVMNADGSGARRLTYGERPGDESPTWSPDGRRIAFADLTGLFVVDAAGGDWQRLTDGPADDGNPAWSPAGPRNAFDGSRGVFNGDIYVVKADSDGMVDITDSLPLDSNPSWSPDGRRLAFMRKQHRRARARIFVMNADGTDQVNLGVIGDAYSRPSWSPDGTRLAYSWLTACIVPMVAGKTLQEARGRVRRASCSVGRVRFVASVRPRGTVLSQRPQARAERRIGARVSLVASRGRRSAARR
jgi:Tol biopolymer transport system component